jgi:hypothetical protein
MALTKAQKKMVNVLLLVIAKLQLRVQKEMREAVLYSIAMHKVSRELKVAIQMGAKILKNGKAKKWR